MISLFGIGKKSDHVLVLDIGSSSVGASVVRVADEKKATIVASTRQHMKLSGDLTFNRFRTSMLRTLDMALMQLEKDGAPACGRALCMFASPWYVSRIKRVHIKKDKPFAVTARGVQEAMEAQVESFRNSSVKKLSVETGQDIEILEAQTMQIRLNGYETNDPYGRFAKHVELAVFLSMSQGDLLDAVEGTVKKVFNVRDLTFHSFPLTAFSTVRDIFSDKHNFLLVDITGEITDISLVRNDMLANTMSFPVGKNSIVRHIAGALNTDPEEVLSLFALAQADKLENAQRKRFDEALAAAGDKWLKEFRGVLASYSGGIALPHTIFFTASPEFGAWFEKLIEESELFDDFRIVQDGFDVRLLNKDMFDPFVEIGPGGIRHDTFLMLEAIFAHKIHKS